MLLDNPFALGLAVGGEFGHGSERCLDIDGCVRDDFGNCNVRALPEWRLGASKDLEQTVSLSTSLLVVLMKFLMLPQGKGISSSS